MKKLIIIRGPLGVGKTTVSKILAHNLHLEYLSLDKIIDDNISIFTLTSHVEKCIERDSKRPKVYGENAARFVQMITTKIKAGHEIDNTDLTVQETVEKIRDKI